MPAKKITLEKRIGKHDRYRALAISETVKLFGCEPTTVRKVIDPKDKRENEQIKRFYNALYSIYKNAPAEAKKVLSA